MKKRKDEYESEFLVITPVNDDSGLVSLSGKYRYNSSTYKFSMTRQSSGTYLMRGSVRVLEKDGTVLKKKIRKNMEEKVSLGPLLDKKTEPEYEIVTTAIYSNSSDIDSLKECIVNGIVRLYSENARLITSSISNNVRPDLITPAVAADTKLEKYVALSHKNVTPETQRTIVNRIKRLCAKLPNLPMATFKKTKMTQLLDEIGVGRETRRDLEGFWKYCCEAGICEGSCPVDIPPRRKRSSRSKQAGVKRASMLTLEEQDMFYADCRKHSRSDDVGCALMLGGGLKPGNIVKMIWKDISFYDEYDHVVVSVKVDRLTGATQNYDRPIAPQAAEIVHGRFDELKEKYGVKAVLEMPVVSLLKSPEKPMDSAALIQSATNKLKKLFNISNATIASLRDENLEIAVANRVLSNSYIENLYSVCNLYEDSGTATFLQAKSFGADPSNDNYISYTDCYGEERLYSTLQILAEDRKIKKVPDCIDLDGEVVKTYTPDSKRAFSGVVCDIYLEPGEEISIECLHGVNGFVKAYQVGEKGRRKKVSDQIEMTLI